MSLSSIAQRETWNISSVNLLIKAMEQTFLSIQILLYTGRKKPHRKHCKIMLLCGFSRLYLLVLVFPVHLMCQFLSGKIAF